MTPVTATTFEVLPSLSSRDDILADPVLREAADRAYNASRTGPWTTLACSVAYCSLSQIVSQGEHEELYAKAQEISRQTGRPRDALLARQFSPQATTRGQVEYLFDLGNWSPFFKPEPGRKYATMLQMLQYPFSRGSIHLPPRTQERSQVTVQDKPIIDPRYYLGPGEIDRRIMALGNRIADRICQTEPLAKVVLGRAFPPSEASSTEGTVDENAVANYTITDWHPVGTCAMGGHEGAKAGVVDDRLRVYGVRGLRVVDASIMPLQVGAHIQATVYAIAEKGAAMIKEDWGSSA